MQFKLDTLTGPLHFRNCRFFLDYLRKHGNFLTLKFHSIDHELFLIKQWSFETYATPEGVKAFYLRITVRNMKTHVQSYERYQYDQVTGTFQINRGRFFALMPLPHLLTSSDPVVFTALFDTACGHCLRKTSCGSPVIGFACSFLRSQIHFGTASTIEACERRHKLNQSTEPLFTSIAVSCFHKFAASSSVALTGNDKRRSKSRHIVNDGILSRVERTGLLIQSGMLKELCRRFAVGPRVCYNEATGMHKMYMRVKCDYTKKKLLLTLLRKLHSRMICRRIVNSPEGMFGLYPNRDFLHKVQSNIGFLKTIVDFISGHFPTGDTRCTISLSEKMMQTVLIDPTIKTLADLVQKRLTTPKPTKRAAIAGGCARGGCVDDDDTDTD